MVLKSMTIYSVGHAVGNRHSHILLGECNPVQPLGGWFGNISQNYIPLLGIYPDSISLTIWRSTCTQLFISALFITAIYLKQSKCLWIKEWLNKDGISTQ